MKGKIVPIYGMRECRRSGGQFHSFLTLALDGFEQSASHPDHLWLDIMLEISCRHKHSLQLCAGDVSDLMTGDGHEKLTQGMISFAQE